MIKTNLTYSAWVQNDHPLLVSEYWTWHWSWVGLSILLLALVLPFLYAQLQVVQPADMDQEQPPEPVESGKGLPPFSSDETIFRVQGVAPLSL